MSERSLRRWTWAGVLLAGGAVLAFLLLTPPDLLRKIDYIGAGVCHRDTSHSFLIAGRQMMLCQRCTGTFTGALLGLLLQWVLLRRRRAMRFPQLWVWGFMVLFFLIWSLDGVNSFTTFGQDTSGWLGYAPQPWLRLLSGSLMGLSMSLLLVPAFNLTVWADGSTEQTVASGGEMALLVGAALLQTTLIYSRADWLLYPVAIYSAAGVLTMFILLGIMVWVMAVGLDQSYTGWLQLWLPACWGIAFAFFVLGGMVTFRLMLTGTIDGMPGVSPARS